MGCANCLTAMCVQTGRIPGHGIQESNLGMTSKTECNANLTMIGKKLHEAGYFTAQIGKVRAVVPSLQVVHPCEE